MYLDDPQRPLRSDGPQRVAPEVRAGHALDRIEKALANSPVDPVLDVPRLRVALSVPLADAEREQQRRFARGWLAWLEGDPSTARTEWEGCTGTRAAYWLARCRLLLGDTEGLSSFEQQMRTFQGSPQATCWFVDLLWRAGRHERAAQVWKSVRVNKRVLACEEAALLESRAFIAQNDLEAAEKALIEASGGNGVLRAERSLLLSWIDNARRNHDSVSDDFVLLPCASRRAWIRLLQRDPTLTFDDLQSLPFSPPARMWIDAQQARLSGSDPVPALASVTVSRLAPFVRYVRAVLGQDDFAVILASLPGPFLAARCRLWATLSRFCKREASNGETLGVLEQASKVGHGVVDLESWIDLLRLLDDPATTPDDLWAGDTNWHRRAAVERCLSSGPSEETTAQLTAWSVDPRMDGALRQHVEHELSKRRVGESVDSLLALSATTSLRQVWEVAQGRAAPDTLRSLVSDETAGPLVLCLLTMDAAIRNDATSLAEWLTPSATWQRLASGPPTFLCGALVRLSGSERGKEALRRWLAQWPQPNAAMATLIVRTGLNPPDSESASPPDGVDAASWLLHQASRALERKEPLIALTWVQRAREQGLNEEQHRVVEAALPSLERLSRAARLSSFTEPHLLVDLTDSLQDYPPDTSPEALAESPDLPPRLAHHLALLNLRAADHFEREERDDLASPCWRRSWHAWLTWVASDAANAPLIINHLLVRHRLRLVELLARNAVARARPLWDVLRALPFDNVYLAQRLQGFRDDLATAYLLDTREAMRHGAIPEGWRVDYEQGLSRLRRLMSLDRDNRVLLTALVEICADWFLDLYDLRDEPRLRQEVERFTPFALQLARAVTKPDQTWPEELSARAALAEFFKFRAFVCDDLEQKRNLYREALAMNPSNDNVRDLLGGMEGKTT